MDSPTRATFAAAQTAFQTAGAAIALLDAEGTVVGWTQAAQRLVGYSAADVVGRSGAVLLAAAEDWEKAPAVAAESSAQGHWSGFVDIRHRDGRTVDVRLCVSLLTGRDGRARWIISVTDKVVFSSWGAGEAAVHTLPSTLRLPGPTPIGVVIRDTAPCGPDRAEGGVVTGPPRRPVECARVPGQPRPLVCVLRRPGLRLSRSVRPAASWAWTGV
jgi:PAS domain S-box-containing protein